MLLNRAWFADVHPVVTCEELNPVLCRFDGRAEPATERFEMYGLANGDSWGLAEWPGVSAPPKLEWRGLGVLHCGEDVGCVDIGVGGCEVPIVPGCITGGKLELARGCCHVANRLINVWTDGKVPENGFHTAMHPGSLLVVALSKGEAVKFHVFHVQWFHYFFDEFRDEET
ncbi:hypothetical protein BD779DRAFT_1475816 [Infundibulicybe gibba]|nr:hypothetical protein BD779DRAFT_1475816 [Infundibulicybe gibba]